MWIFFRLCTVYPIWIPSMHRPSLVSRTFPTSKKKYLTKSKVPKVPKKLPPIHGPSTEEHAKTQVEILCFLFSLNSLRFFLTREIDTKMTSQKLINLQNINSWMIEFNKTQILANCQTAFFVLISSIFDKCPVRLILNLNHCQTIHFTENFISLILFKN